MPGFAFVSSPAARALPLLAVLAACGGAPAETPAGCLAALPGERIALPGGGFRMGSDASYPEEGPARPQTVGSFSIDPHEVTNRQFAEFVEATGHVTVAERPPTGLPPGAPSEMRAPGSAVFRPPAGNERSWWHWQPGAYWRAPEGPGSSVAGREAHPVVHVAYEDALAYAEWRGGDLPTAEEWEYAARGGLEGATYEWGGEQRPGGLHRANTHQGPFPVRDTGEDGHAGTAPVGCYLPNGFGLYDMTGNVWELTRTPAPGPGAYVIKGGSYLCSNSYCSRGRPAAWQPIERGFGTSHIGFRLVYRTGRSEG